MISQDSISKVLASADIVDVAGRFIKLKKNTGCCPFHDEKTPSFHVNSQKEIFKCFGCGKGGNAINFIMEHEGMSYPEAITLLANWYNVEIEFENGSKNDSANNANEVAELQQLIELVSRFYQGNKDENVYQDYLAFRGISKTTANYFNLGYAPDAWRFLTDKFIPIGKFDYALKLGLVNTKNDKNFDTFRNRLIIPINDTFGKLVGFGGRALDAENKVKYLNSTENVLYRKERILFGLDKAKATIKEQGYAILTEGYLDVINLHQADVCNAVASCGTSLTIEQTKLINRYTGTVIIFYDGDKAGIKATQKAALMLLSSKIEVKVFNIKDEDPDSWVRTIAKKDDLNSIGNQIFEQSIPLFDWLLETLFKDKQSVSSKDTALNFLTEAISFEKDFLQDELLKQCAKRLKTTVTVLRKRMKAPAGKSSIKEIKADTKSNDLLPEGVDETEFEQFGFWEHKGVYWSINSKGGKYSVSNFIMEILFHVHTGGEDAYRLMKIKNVYGRDAVINMNTDDFVSLASFKKIIARRGNFIWKGNDVDLVRLQDKLQRDERATDLIDVMGYHPKGNFYAFANGIIDLNEKDNQNQFNPVDEYGIVEHKEKNYFIPANAKMYADKEDMMANYKKFVYIKRDYPFQDWAKLFFNVYGDNGKIGFFFYLASIFSGAIYKILGRRFPILSLYGLRGSGKGTFAESILRLFGEPQDQIMLGGSTTSVGFMRSFAQFRDGMVWLDEYKNNLPKKVIESIKNIFDRQGYKRGKKDHSFEVDTVPVQSSCMLSGQEMPNIEPALFTRVIMLIFEETKHNEESRAKYRALKEQETKGLSHLTVYLLQYGPFFLENFKSVLEAEVKEISLLIEGEAVEERMIQNYACLSAISKLLIDKENIGFRHNTFRTLLVQKLLFQQAVLVGNDDTAKFWQVVESLFAQNQIREGVDFMLADGKLYIRLQNISGLYEKEMRMRNDPNSLSKATLENYLSIDKTKFITKKKKQFKDGSYTHCFIFNYRALDINLMKFGEHETAETIAAKYKEMEIDFEPEGKVSDTDKAQGAEDKKEGEPF